VAIWLIFCGVLDASPGKISLYSFLAQSKPAVRGIDHNVSNTTKMFD
jgi:hypothetical protein